MDHQARLPHMTAHPADAATWLAGAGGRTVVALNSAELAGSLTALGHDVLVSETASFSLPDNSVDVVVATHRLPRELDEVARVLRPGGRIALVVNDRDRRIPWVKKLDRILGSEPVADPVAALVVSERFGFVEDTTYRFWQIVDRDSLCDIVRDLPEVRDLGGEAREAVLAAVQALYDDYGRGHDGMQLPWVSRCFRATVVDDPIASPRPMEETGEMSAVEEPGDDGLHFGISDGTDTEMLLIDFR